MRNPRPSRLSEGVGEGGTPDKAAVPKMERKLCRFYFTTKSTVRVSAVEGQHLADVGEGLHGHIGLHAELGDGFMDRFGRRSGTVLLGILGHAAGILG